ncbi:MAG TPA: DegT/DnrJ/EryC1/StrS family aminotransferase [Deltaproteobacteria bacterium]|nr:DegT/DnrJ/EryC1/StrS family aminotransferase [Deltaproteobacteria bacterium]
MAGAELIGQEEIKEVVEILETGVLMRYGFDAQRKGMFKVREFEEAFAKYCGTNCALGVTSGSAALKVALTALDVGPGDDVLVPAFTFLATYEAVLEVGAVPIMVDIDETLNLDPKEIAKKKTPYTKAVIPVHMCGSAAHIDKILEEAQKYKLLVLEDNAQGCGAGFKGKKLGSFGDMGCFSFDYVKTITTGEGGMIISNNKDLYNRAEWYHDHGHDHNPKVSRALEGRTILGFNYRMNELQGALGLVQLRKLDYVCSEQKKNKKVIKDALAQVPGVKFRVLPDPEGDSATFLAFNLPEEAQAKKFQKTLAEEGLDTVCYKENLWHYVPNWEHFLARSTANSKQYPFTDPSYKGKIEYSRASIPYAEDILGRTLVIQIAVKMGQEKLDAITKTIEKAAKKI